LTERTVTVRMTEALAVLLAKYRGHRIPKAFYLGPDDYADFMATDPPTGEFPWGNNPTKTVVEPAFERVPVRLSKNVPPRQSRLYDHCGYGKLIPQ
jgi:hypothetical protein